RLHFWSLVENITGQREVEDAMRQALTAAEGASAAKSDFLANMSHEIRTPMNAILGMLQLLQRSGLQPRQRDYADKADTAARALLGLINDILDFSKIEAGRQVLDPHPFELQPLLHELSVLVSAGVAEKDIEVVFDVDPALPARLVGDAMRLKQVLINLTGNAIKFTAFGEVVVCLRQVADDGERVTIGIEVRDTGIGIAPEHLERIFEGFSQAEASTTRRFGGTGLGLAISRRLVQLMGGELQVDSERGRGSRFHFEVPFEHDATALAAPPDAAEAALLAATPGLRVLVVDDNRTARESLAALGHALGWTVESVDSGPRALARLEGAAVAAEHFDVVFLDWRMPGIDGWETAQRIRERGLHGAARLLAMVTAQGRELLERRAESEPSPLDGYLVKPITASVLAASVHGAPRASSEPVPLTGPAEARAHTVRSGRLDGLRVLVVEDNPVNQLVVRDLLTGEGASVEIADGGHAALRALVGEAHRFDVVLMDIQMPGMDGYTATRQIRGRLGIARLPIIAMTANVQPSDRDAALAAGMNDHIGKPFDLDTLIALLQRWTGRAPASAAAPPATPAPAAVEAPPRPAAESPVFEPDAAIARFGGKVATFRAALDRFDSDVAARLDAYGKALAGGAHDVAARELHTLKGVSATIGGTRLARSAAEIEHEAPQPSGGLVVLARVKRLRAEVHALREAIDAWRERHAAAAGPPAPASLDPARLQSLAALLADSNLRALSLWGELEAAVAAADPAIARAIGEAIGRMDFDAARSALGPMLDQRDASTR
ncbi:MAG: response regulator, partial [Pseudomonas sp.]|nr:response regulator [Pseudomonas sp.]